MTICYNISPELNMVMYVCRGLVNGADIFKTADIVFRDERRRPGMITMIDLFYAVENFYLEDLHASIKRIERALEEGIVPEPIVLLSRSKGIHLWAETIQMLPSKVPFQMKAFDSMDEAIVWMDLSALQGEIIKFWHDCIALSENS